MHSLQNLKKYLFLFFLGASTLWAKCNLSLDGEVELIVPHVTIAEYCQFLNERAPADPYSFYDEKMAGIREGAYISRSGDPGNYQYEVSSGTEDPVHYVSSYEAIDYSNDAVTHEEVILSSNKDMLLVSIQGVKPS